jgi:hypothetical protein
MCCILTCWDEERNVPSSWQGMSRWREGAGGLGERVLGRLG